MRILTAYTSAEIAKAVTRPFYVAKIGFNTPLLLSSRGTITVGSDTFIANGFTITSVTKANGGKITGSIMLSNHDLVMSGLILNQGVKNRVFQLYILYGDGPFVASDRVLVIDGIMDGVPNIGTSVTISFATGPLLTNNSPRIFYSKPTFNHCPPPDTTISWNNERKVIPAPEAL